ncbi:MAG TPA: transcription initiation factor E subunit alpha [Aquificaceae bacterium]|nr:transcription initiation factor E subunit alpha [Aquificaceae bacterium]
MKNVADVYFQNMIETASPITQIIMLYDKAIECMERAIELYDARLVDYTREKEEDINWYTYTWKPTLDKLPWVVRKRGQELLKKLKEQLTLEENNMFFYCPKCEIKYIFEEAMDCGFRCPHCGGVLKEYDNSRDIEILKNQIKFLEEELKSNIFLVSPPSTTSKTKGRKRSRRKVKS